MLRVCFWILAVAALAILLPEAAQACPNCKDAMQNDPAAAGMIRGYFWSIIFMMSMPFLILGSFSAYMYHEVRKARAAQKPAEQLPAVSR